MARTLLRVRYLALVGAVLLAGIVGSLTARPAHAQFGVCVGDPMFWLSNGRQLDATVLVTGSQKTLKDIRSIQYTIALPAGVTVVGTYEVPTAFAPLESWTIATTPTTGANEYTTTAVVTTGQTSPQVLLSQALFNPGAFQLVTDTALGSAGQTLSIDEPNGP